MRRTVALSALLFLATPAAAADVAAASKIDAVTVYRTSARVSRVAQLQLPAGDARVLLAGLPAQLDDDSIRVTGKGTAKARILGVSVEAVTRAEVADAAARAAEQKLEALQAEDHGLEDKIRVAQARAKFVESLRSTYSEERAKNLAVRGVAAKEWAELSAFVEAELGAASVSQRKAEAARRELARRIEAARADLEKLHAKRSETTKTVAVELDADRSGAFELTVSYVIASAGWQPIWDARLAPDQGKVELALRGTVAQSSGEDWREVRLSLSTAQPSRGLFVPKVEPVYLNKLVAPPRPARSKKAYGDAMTRAMPSAPARAAGRELGAVAEEEPAPLAMEAPEADVQQGLLATTYTAPRRETVDGSGQARKVDLARYPLAAQISRTAAPRVDPAAFLTAKVTNDTGVPLLPGLAGVYVGDEFVGRAPLAATPAGGELELSFGADDRIEVQRRVLERRHETAGIVSKDEIWKYRARISVKNRYAAPAAVKLLDLVPVSRDEGIKVSLLDGSTPPTREDPERPGVRIWELSLEPRAEKVVEIRYEVRYPRGFPIQGLE